MADEKLYLAERDLRRRRIRRRARIILLILLLVAFLGGGGWLIFRSPVFRVQSVEVRGTERMSPETVRNFADGLAAKSFWGRILGTGHLWTWGRRIADDDLRMLPNAKSLRIETSYRNRTITIAVEEREPYGIWCFRSDELPACFWFEADGTLFEPAPEAEGGLIRVVGDHAQREVSLGTTVLSGVFMENLRSVFRVIEASSLAVREVRYEDPELQEVRLVTYGGPELLFSLRFPAENTISVIEQLVARGGNGTAFKDLKYVDFRVENRAYYQ